MNPIQPAALPPRACDTHFHLFGPADRFPYADDRPYTPDDAGYDAMRDLHASLGIERGVIVHPGCHGFDLAVTLDGLRRGAGSYRAIALLPPDPSAARLRELDAAGVRGVRYNFVAHLANVPWHEVEAMARAIAPFGWHLCIHADAASLPALLPRLATLPVPVVIDHMGRVDAGLGVGDATFQALLALREQRNVWVKISGIDRISRIGRRPFTDGEPFVAALLDAMPERLLWGTDWPHPNVRGECPDEAELLATLRRLCPDDATLTRVLVDNPHTLYRFDD